MNSAENLTAKIEVLPASLEQKPILRNLLELYSHDFCDYVDLEIGPDGRYGYKDLDIYWTEPQRHPFLVWVESRLAGFVFVDRLERGSPALIVWDVAEFFVLRGYRRKSIGTEVAHRLWKVFPGRWEVRVIITNEPAHRFWQRAVESFVGHEVVPTRVTQGGKDRYRFAFDTRPAGEPRGD
jgi:predicted acetyltransferase